MGEYKKNKCATSISTAAQGTYCCSQALPQGKQRLFGLGNEVSSKTKHLAFLFQMQHPNSSLEEGSTPWGWPALTIHGHFINLGGVVLLNVPQDADVIILYKVDGNTFSAIPARPANSVEAAQGKRGWSHLGEE